MKVKRNNRNSQNVHIEIYPYNKLKKKKTYHIKCLFGMINFANLFLLLFSLFLLLFMSPTTLFCTKMRDTSLQTAFTHIHNQ